MSLIVGSANRYGQKIVPLNALHTFTVRPNGDGSYYINIIFHPQNESGLRIRLINESDPYSSTEYNELVNYFKLYNVNLYNGHVYIPPGEYSVVGADTLLFA